MSFKYSTWRLLTEHKSRRNRNDTFQVFYTLHGNNNVTTYLLLNILYWTYKERERKGEREKKNMGRQQSDVKMSHEIIYISSVLQLLETLEPLALKHIH